MEHFDLKNAKVVRNLGLSKKEACLRGRVAAWPFGRNYINFISIIKINNITISSQLARKYF